MKESPRVELWSSGGGVQSTAIGGLIVLGRLPKPDLAVIADTGYELSTTWDYYENVTKPALAKIGVDLVRVKKEDYATVDLYSKKEKSLLIPAFTSQSGAMGKLPTYCSSEWKTRVIHRWANEQRPNSKFKVWMGFTLDEGDRMNFPEGKWEQRYPLIKAGMYRYDCFDVIKELGWPEPPRSSCYMCPNKHQSEWAWQKDNAPSDYQMAVDFEQTIQVVDPHVWLNQEGKPLDECNFNSQQDLFIGGCESGNCFT